MHNKIYVNARFLQQNVTGVQRYALDYCELLVRQGYDVTFLTPGDLDKDLIPKGWKVECFGWFGGHIWEQFILPVYLLLKGSPLLINFCGLPPLKYRNVITTIHDVSVFVKPEWFSRSYSWWYRFAFKILANNSWSFITCSTFSKNQISQYLGISPDIIFVIYPSSTFKPNASTVRKNIDAKNILAVSSIDPRKNFSILIKSLSFVSERELKIKIAGGAGKAFKSILLENDNVEFLGYVSDDELLCLYQDSDVFIYPSLYEGFGIPPLEAMSQGCPVLASSSASIPEACGDAALYFNPNDPKDLAMKIDMLLDDIELRDKMIARGYANINRFNRNDEFEKLSGLINRFFSRAGS